MTIHYTSRFPEITREVPVKTLIGMGVGAKIVEMKAKDRVPVQSGRLRDAIHVDQQGQHGFAVVAGDSNAFYGHMVEHGTSHSPAHPFLVPALEESRMDIEHAITAALRSL